MLTALERLSEPTSPGRFGVSNGKHGGQGPQVRFVQTGAHSKAQRSG
ncbi:Uncharacterised protein [Actinomyces bovis]|uniref:Uncharacterized protein n=1 Tax=Actinomyces bovis TaxID=1658 RepID=A0ABY1VLH7_9ACTO|nr:Uncharacterised protein [Actinomyces bovis]VEG54970.1 Uncharacterised protein [Actinomyces israelii]